MKHEKICVKNRQKDSTRKPFDSSKHRAMGTDLESYNIQKKYNKTSEDRLKMIAYERVRHFKVQSLVFNKWLTCVLQQAQKKKQWKRKHEEFVNAIRSAREYDAATKTGKTTLKFL